MARAAAESRICPQLREPVHSPPGSGTRLHWVSDTPNSESWLIQESLLSAHYVPGALYTPSHGGIVVPTAEEEWRLRKEPRSHS